MRLIIGGSIFFFVLLTIGCIFLLGQESGEFGLAALMVLGFLTVVIVSGSLSAYLWYKRGKVYEERGESGPDD
ncbi:hypothetical protein [Hyphococcus sp.]|uniref:hypothetical protein n=1 Tax=Hyphococcus sp. TaxID=2038636 RepID=UPI00207F0135|nr:MAG: hypothetical protein DHS20C04_30190 [Marinicaulis sp.]